MLKCSKCKIERSKNLFIKNGKTLKSCGVCRGVVVLDPPSSSSDDEGEGEDEGEEDVEDEEVEDELYCPVCEKYFDTESQVIKHSQSAIHKKKLSNYNN
jgi:uncharacterized Zn finger protein (UPF0148 family)